MIYDAIKHPISLLTLYQTFVGLIACKSGWWWWRWQWHSIREGLPWPGGCIHRRPRDRGEPGPLVGVPISSCWSRWRGRSSDGALVPHHGGRRRRRGKRTALVRVKTLSNQCRGRRRRRRGNGASVIEAGCAVRTGSESFIVIDHRIAISLAITTVGVSCSSRGSR